MTEMPVLTTDMIIVLGILVLTLYLFVSEIVRVDTAAIIIMVALGVISYFWTPLVPVENLFDGFSSNAVISIIAVMIIGAGLDKTGLMSKVAVQILKIGGTTEKRIIPIISGTVGFISCFMQNVGAAALFLPVVSRISTRSGLALSRLLMPMGFCAILGGTVTMIGSSPLILLNDLILASNRALPEGVDPMRTFHLFDVTPVGVALLATGILYFVVFGRFILPLTKGEIDQYSAGGDMMKYFRENFKLSGELFEATVSRESSLAYKSVSDIESLSNYDVLIVALEHGNSIRISPIRDVVIEAGSDVALMGSRKSVEEFSKKFEIKIKAHLDTFSETLSPSNAGIAEIVIPPRSQLVGKSLGQIRMRKTYGFTIMAVYRGEETIKTDLRDLALRAGDTLILHTTWDDLFALEKNPNFVVVTTDYPHEELRPQKVKAALLFFAVALGLILFTDIRLSVALLTGAIGMIVSGVIKMDEAYQAVSWKTVFLLASLIPLGMAVEITGTAAWLAHQTLNVVGDVPAWVLQTIIAVLATFFTLVMSNVGATVLLVPLAVNIAVLAGANPAVFALTVGIATSNSFLIPTHQVNAMIMGPAGYRVVDFVRAGSIMTVLFLIVSMVMMNLVF